MWGGSTGHFICKQWFLTECFLNCICRSPVRRKDRSPARRDRPSGRQQERSPRARRSRSPHRSTDVRLKRVSLTDTDQLVSWNDEKAVFRRVLALKLVGTSVGKKKVIIKQIIYLLYYLLLKYTLLMLHCGYFRIFYHQFSLLFI